MKLSGGERLILVMLSEMYEHLGIKGQIDHRFIQSAIVSGHSWSIEEKYSGLVNPEEPDPKVVQETADLLWMWSILEDSFDRLPAEDKKYVWAKLHPLRTVAFPGFDANNEPHYSVARHWIEELGGFEQFKDRDLNSHDEHLGTYRRMREIFGHVLKEDPDGILGADQLIRVLEERNR